MDIEIFELRGYEIDTELDVLIMDAYKKNSGKVKIKKIDVVDKNSMKKHKDIVSILKSDGLESLPLIKVDGRVVKKDKLERMLMGLISASDI